MSSKGKMICHHMQALCDIRGKGILFSLLLMLEYAMLHFSFKVRADDKKNLREKRPPRAEMSDARRRRVRDVDARL